MDIQIQIYEGDRFKGSVQADLDLWGFYVQSTFGALTKALPKRQLSAVMAEIFPSKLAPANVFAWIHGSFAPGSTLCAMNPCEIRSRGRLEGNISEVRALPELPFAQWLS